jgi:hypothetical protein
LELFFDGRTYSPTQQRDIWLLCQKTMILLTRL